MPRDLLKNILNQGRIGKIENGTAYLKESKENATLRLIKIKNMPENSVVISCDGFDSQTFFNKGNGQNMRCDFLIVTPGYLHFIELKSNEKAESTYQEDCIKKFKAVSSICHYIDSVIDIFYHQQLHLDKKSKRFILFYHSPSIPKTITSLKSSQKQTYNTPEIFLSWGVQNEAEIDFSML